MALGKLRKLGVSESNDADSLRELLVAPCIFWLLRWPHCLGRPQPSAAPPARAARARARAALRRREKLATVNFFFINFNN